MITMEVDEAIRERRSIRKYSSRSVPQELVREVLQAGTWAPSPYNDQPWRFTVLTGDAKKAVTDLFRSELEDPSAKIGAKRIPALSSCQVMEQAPVLVIAWNERAIEEPFSEETRARVYGHKADLQSVAAAIQNMLLKAYSVGLGSLWICDIYYAIDALFKYFGKEWELVAAVALGWPVTTPKPPLRRTVEEVSEFLS